MIGARYLFKAPSGNSHINPGGELLSSQNIFLCFASFRKNSLFSDANKTRDLLNKRQSNVSKKLNFLVIIDSFLREYWTASLRKICLTSHPSGNLYLRFSSMIDYLCCVSSSDTIFFKSHGERWHPLRRSETIWSRCVKPRIATTDGLKGFDGHCLRSTVACW